MKKIIMTTMLCLFAWTNIALSAENVIHYSNRPGNMLVKYNDVILATIGNGKVNITEAGELMLDTNLSTEGRIYLNDKRTGNNILNVTSRYFAKYNATLHILNDTSGMTLVSVTINGKPGFVHSINVVEFLATVEKNLEDNLVDAQEALEAAIRDGAGDAAVEAAEAAVAEATKSFTNFELALRSSGLSASNTVNSSNATTVNGVTGTISDYENYNSEISSAEYSVDAVGNVSADLTNSLYGHTEPDISVTENGSPTNTTTETSQANVTDASK